MKMKNPQLKVRNTLAVIVLSVVSTSYGVAVERFAPPAFNAPLNNFDKRFSSNQLNTSFILARVLNEARIIKREGDNFRTTAEIFRSNNNSSAVSNSVIIPPGTKADTIIVINQNDGDSYAIQR